LLLLSLAPEATPEVVLPSSIAPSKLDEARVKRRKEAKEQGREGRRASDEGGNEI
jgi:hypothetical protein